MRWSPTPAMGDDEPLDRDLSLWWVTTWWSFASTLVVAALFASVVRGDTGGDTEEWGTARWVLAALCAGAALVGSEGLRHVDVEGRWGPRARHWIAGALGVALIAWGVAVAADLPWYTAVLPWTVGSLAAVMRPGRSRMRVLTAVAAAVVLVFLVCGGSADFSWSRDLWLTVAVCALMTSAIWFQMWIFGLIVRLYRTGRMQAELARSEERLRFAADLHDIQGHHLQVIALRAELAARLFSRDPVAARENIDGVAHLARTALAETREIVRGYDTTSLEGDLDRVIEVLTAAGAEVATDVVPGLLGADGDRVAGFVLRETTTNILRHARPDRVEIALRRDGDRAVLSVTNDGADTDGSARARGAGLAGVERRVAEIGGAVEHGCVGRSFTVTVTLPTGEETRR